MIDPAPDTRVDALRGMTIKFDILNRLSREIQFTADIDCSENTARAVKVGLAVLWGLKNNADLQGADLSGADLQGADLQGADLQGANLSSATLSDANLRAADLREADLWYADLREANLREANLRNTGLWAANLSRAALWRADLSGADLWEANLRNAGLREVNLWQVDLRGCDLLGANYLFSFGPIGKQRRMGSLSIDKSGEPIVHLGCFMGSEAEALAKITRDYGEPNTYGPIVSAMCAEARRMASECKAPESEAA